MYVLYSILYITAAIMSLATGFVMGLPKLDEKSGRPISLREPVILGVKVHYYVPSCFGMIAIIALFLYRLTHDSALTSNVDGYMGPISILFFSIALGLSFITNGRVQVLLRQKRTDRL